MAKKYDFQKNGKNKLAPPKETSAIIMYIRQFLNPFWLLLLGAAALSLITYAANTTVPLNLYVAIVLAVITVVMCTASFYQERKAKNV